MTQLLDYFLHLDRYLIQLTAWAGNWSYGILFAIIFCETGLVITPFLPGDSFLFAAGSLAAVGGLNIYVLMVVFLVAAFSGNEMNYQIGKHLGVRLVEGPFKRVIDKRHLAKAEKFFERYGNKAVVVSRFIPIVRTFVPFIAGITKMDYREFAMANLIGAVLWVGAFTAGGYFFGNIPQVKQNFSFVVLAILIISILPAVYEWWRSRKI